MKFDLLSLQAFFVAAGILLVYFGQRVLSSWRADRRERREAREKPPG